MKEAYKRQLGEKNHVLRALQRASTTNDLPNKKFTKPCAFYRLGRCKKGDECTYLHIDEPGEPRNDKKVSWRRKDSNGAANDDQNTTRQNIRPARNCIFHANGYCKFGSKCTFSHAGDSAGRSAANEKTAKSAVDIGFLQLQSRNIRPATARVVKAPSAIEFEVHHSLGKVSPAAPGHEWSDGLFRPIANLVGPLHLGKGTPFIACHQERPLIAICPVIKDGTSERQITIYNSQTLDKVGFVFLPGQGGAMCFDPLSGHLLVVLRELGHILRFRSPQIAQGNSQVESQGAWVLEGEPLKLSNAISESMDSMFVSRHPDIQGIILNLNYDAGVLLGLPPVLVYTLNGVNELAGVAEVCRNGAYLMVNKNQGCEAIMLGNGSQVFLKDGKSRGRTIELEMGECFHSKTREAPPVLDTLLPCPLRNGIGAIFGIENAGATMNFHVFVPPFTVTKECLQPEGSGSTMTTIRGLPSSISAPKVVRAGFGDQIFVLSEPDDIGIVEVYAIQPGWIDPCELDKLAKSNANVPNAPPLRNMIDSVRAALGNEKKHLPKMYQTHRNEQPSSQNNDENPAMLAQLQLQNEIERRRQEEQESLMLALRLQKEEQERYEQIEVAVQREREGAAFK